MKVLGRARMAGAAVAAAAVIGGGGFALGAVTAEPGRAASPAAAGYKDVVRQVLPSRLATRWACPAASPGASSPRPGGW